MRALITGGAGFLGSCLVDHLLAAGWDVEVLDDLSQGTLDNLREALKKKGFQFHLGSILDADRTASLVERADFVFHLAALVGIPVVLEAGVKTLDVNARGSYTVLRACAEHEKRCILFSSSEVYGNGNGKPFAETDPVNLDDRGSIRWLYAVAKVCAERVAMHWYRSQGLPVTVVRPFNATGSRQSLASGQVVPVFIRRALQGEALHVFGTGEQRRTFVSGSDLVNQVIGLAMDHRSIGQVFNVGGEEELSINELAHLVKELLRSRSAIDHVDYREVYGDRYLDIKKRKPDLSRLKSLGYCGSLQPVRDLILKMASQIR